MMWIWDVVAWISLPLLAMLAGVMIWKKLEREFPFFFAYTTLTALIGLIRFIAYKGYSANVYFYVFWISDSVILLVTFLAIYETFLKRIFPGFARVRFYRYLFPVVAIIIGAAALIIALHSMDTRGAFLATARIFDFLRSAVIGFFVLLILFMGRSFAGYEFTITLGFGIQAAVALANGAVRLQQRGVRSVTWDRLEAVAFDLACFIWLWSFSRGGASATRQVEVLNPENLEKAKKWEKSLKDFITHDKR
jgi:hypothetical protein